MQKIDIPILILSLLISAVPTAAVAESPPTRLFTPQAAQGATENGAAFVTLSLDETALERLLDSPAPSSGSPWQLTLPVSGGEITVELDTAVGGMGGVTLAASGQARAHPDSTATFVVDRAGGVRVRLVIDGAVEIIEPAAAGGYRSGASQRRPVRFELPPRVTEVSGATPSGRVPATGALAETAASDTVDLLVVHTDAAARELGSAAALEAAVAVATMDTNRALADSGVPLRIEVRGTRRVDHAESDSIETELTDLTTTDDGVLDEVHALRDALGADLVMLVTRPTAGAACGFAGYSFSTTNGGPRVLRAEAGFSVVTSECLFVDVFAHELGHNFGAQHDRFVARDPGLYEHSYGYVTPSASRITLMAYRDACEAIDPQAPCAVLERFSNPDQSVGGEPIGRPAGSADSANNVLTLNRSRGQVAAFRTRPVVATEPTLGIGLGQGGEGYLEVVDATAPFAHRDWPRVPWTEYARDVGETRPARCDTDGDGRTDTVVGLDSYPVRGGWFLVMEDDGNRRWLRVPYPDYNAANGETFAACGDIDGDGRDEIVVGLGRGGAGWTWVVDDASTGYAPYPDTPTGLPGWLRLGWASYNAAGGAVHPAVGNLDADRAEEIVLATGAGGQRWVQVLDDAGAGFAASANTPAANGFMRAGDTGSIAPDDHEVWPAVCAGDGAGSATLVLGASSAAGAGGGGWLQVLDPTARFAPSRSAPVAGGWLRVPWGAYAADVGSTRPACGGADDDGAHELAVGLGSYPDRGGYVALFDGAGTRWNLLGWPRVRWSDYVEADGATVPTLDR